ncbi:TPA: hypothetical protein JBI56_06800 [Legionella pneumophila]|nr:hypothetical protein [Legionella pneumophila]
MKLLLFITFFLFSSLLSAEPALFYCPDAVICTGNLFSSCKIINNRNDMWKFSSQGSVGNNCKKLSTKREYKFYAVSALKQKPLDEIKYFFSRCLFHTKNIDGCTYTIGIGPVQSVPLHPYMHHSLWEKEAPFINDATCKHSDPRACPMIEGSYIGLSGGMHVNGNFRKAFLYYVDPISGEYKHKTNIGFNELVSICGITSNCIIDIGAPGLYGDNGVIYFDHIALVNLDTTDSNFVRINQVNADPGLKLTLVKDAIFNIVHIIEKL